MKNPTQAEDEGGTETEGAGEEREDVGMAAGVTDISFKARERDEQLLEVCREKCARDTPCVLA